MTRLSKLFELKFRKIDNRIVRFVNFLVNERFLTLFQPETLLETIIFPMCF